MWLIVVFTVAVVAVVALFAVAAVVLAWLTVVVVTVSWLLGGQLASIRPKGWLCWKESAEDGSAACSMSNHLRKNDQQQQQQQ